MEKQHILRDKEIKHLSKKGKIYDMGIFHLFIIEEGEHRGTYAKMDDEIYDGMFTALLKKERLPEIIPQVRRLLRKHKGEWIKIYDRPFTRDAFIEIIDSPDRLSLSIVYHPAMGKGKNLSDEEIFNLLISKGYKADFIDVGQINLAIQRPGQSIVVAKGVPPQKGQDAKIEVLTKNKGHSEEIVEEDNSLEQRIDWHEYSSKLEVIKQGDVVIRKIPPTEGVPGIDVRGNVIPPERGKDIYLDTVISEGLKLVSHTEVAATKTGLLKRRGDKYYIEETYIVEGDLDFSIGNIKDIKNLEVRGDIKPGFKIKIEGTLIVRGSIENATVEADTIKVLGTITNKGGGYIKANNLIQVRDVIQGKLICEGDIIIEKVSRHSSIMAGRHVIIVSPKGSIVGGTIKATFSIVAPNIGNAYGTPTQVYAGYTEDIKQLVETLKTQKGNLVTKLELLKKNISKYTSPMLKQKARQNMTNIEEELVKIEENLVRLNNILKEASKQKIYVNGVIYPDVTLQINSFPPLKTVTKYQHVIYGFSDEEGKTTFMPYKRPNIKLPRI